MAAADVVQQRQFLLEFAGVGQQAFEQDFVVAGGNRLGDVHGEDRAGAFVLYSLHLNLGGRCR
jgi:hypothetical protein